VNPPRPYKSVYTISYIIVLEFYSARRVLDRNNVKLLLDTHTFIWWDSDPAKLSATAMALCSDPANELILSVTSLWEMQIKHQLGKLSLRLPLVDVVAHQQATNGVIVLPILPTHAVRTPPIVGCVRCT
jgi:hypothetical protein